MERSSKRGKIPQHDWPSIMERHAAGETLASIARTYDCSPPAISYIVSRSRARSAAAEMAVPGTVIAAEPQLIKTHATSSAAAPLPPARVEEMRGGFGQATPPQPFPPERRELHGEDRRSEPRLVADEPARAPGPHTRSRDANGSDRYFAGQPEADPAGPSRSFAPVERFPQNNEARRTLHLSLPHADGPDPHQSQPPSPGTDRYPPRPAQPAHQGYGQMPRQGLEQYPPAPNTAPVRMLSGPPRSKEGGTIDQALRERVDSDIAAFLAAFDAALAADTLENRAGLREATDRLLRAGARTRIDLERLEARVPLPPRDKGGQEGLAWRHR